MKRKASHTKRSKKSGKSKKGSSKGFKDISVKVTY